MLANLLPGFRDLRAPLAAGYLWLAAIWVWFAHVLPSSPNEATGFLKRVYELAGAAGRPAIGIALSFTAYLLGVLMTEIVGRILQFPIIILHRLGKYLMYYARRGGAAIAEVLPGILFFFPSLRGSRLRLNPVTDEVHEIIINELDSKYQDDEAFRAQVRDHLTEPFVENLSGKILFGPSNRDDILRMASEQSYIRRDLMAAVIDTYEHTFEVNNDLGYVPARIIEEKPKIFERYDQLRSEGEFRIAVSFPIAILIIALMRQTGLHIVLGLLFICAAALLWLQGGRKHTAATLQLTQAIRTNPADSPPLDRMKKGTIHWLSEPKELRPTPLGFSWTHKPRINDGLIAPEPGKPIEEDSTAAESEGVGDTRDGEGGARHSVTEAFKGQAEIDGQKLSEVARSDDPGGASGV
jgi:hypothetical protein